MGGLCMRLAGLGALGRVTGGGQGFDQAHWLLVSFSRRYMPGANGG